MPSTSSWPWFTDSVAGVYDTGCPLLSASTSSGGLCPSTTTPALPAISQEGTDGVTGAQPATSSTYAQLQPASCGPVGSQTPAGKQTPRATSQVSPAPVSQSLS